MTDVMETEGDGPQVNPLVSAADVTGPVAIAPVMMTDAYVEIGTANLSCLGIEVSIEPELKPIELTTFCGVVDYPGPVKWHFKAKLAQDFSAGSTDATLTAVLAAYKTAQTLCPFRVRARKSAPVGITNPFFTGNMIPQDYTLFGGAAGAASEVDIDWIMAAPPTRATT
jgi:hypothetical protein